MQVYNNMRKTHKFSTFRPDFTTTTKCKGAKEGDTENWIQEKKPNEPSYKRFVGALLYYYIVYYYQ